jgi:hypothetical protein
VDGRPDVVEEEEEELTLMPMMLLRLSRALLLASVLIAGKPEIWPLPTSVETFPSLTTVQKEKLFAGSSALFGLCCCTSPASGE